MKDDNKKVEDLKPLWWRSRFIDEIISTSEQILNETSRLSTGSKTIDKIFNGGIPKHILFEITGEAGTGKTQWCLTLAASVLLRNIDYKKIEKVNNIGIICILYTDNGLFPKERLFEILYFRIEFEYKQNNSKDKLEENEKVLIKLLSENLLKYIKIYKIDTLFNMDRFIQKTIPLLFLNNKVDALIIDSITNLYRSKISFSDSTSTSTGLLQLSNIFKRIVIDHNCWLIVTNQITTETNSTKIINNSSNKKPSLGLLWSNSINWRILLTKKMAPSSNNPIRELNIVLSSEIPKMK